MVVVQTACGPGESQHTRGLTIQRSQGQGRQPFRPEGAPPAAGVLRSKLLWPAMGVRRRQDNTPEWCVSTEKIVPISLLWVSVPSLALSFQPFSLLVVFILTWLWQPTMTQK